MGLTDIRVRVSNPADLSRFAELKFLVDSGAVYTVVPTQILTELGIVPHSERDFILANGEVVHRSMGTAAFEYFPLGRHLLAGVLHQALVLAGRGHRFGNRPVDFSIVAQNDQR